MSIEEQPATDRATPISFHRSIRWRLAGLVAVLIAATTLLLTFVGYVFLRDVLRRNLEHQLQVYGQGLSESIGSFSQLQEERAVLVSSRAHLRQLLADHMAGRIDETRCSELARPILQNATDSLASFRRMHVADHEGRIVADSDGTTLGDDVSAHESYVRGRARVHVSLPKRYEDRFEATLGAPISTEDGRQLGVLLIETDMAQLPRLLQGIVSGYSTARVRLATRIGSRIRYVLPVEGVDTLEVAAIDDPAMASALRGERGFADGTTANGNDVIASYSPAGHRNWGLVVQCETAEAYAPSGGMTMSLILIGLASCVIASVVGLRLATSFTRPIRKLSDAALAIEHGDLSTRAPLERSDEIGMLARAFNHMALAMQDFQDEMQRRVADRTDDLQRSQEQLRIALENAERASSAKTNFLAGMSHEIRTPMNGIIGMTEILLESSHLRPDVRRRVQIVHESGQMLLRLINDILDLSKVEAGKLELIDRDFSVRELLDVIQQNFEPIANKKGLELFCNVDEKSPDYVRGDPHRLRQVLTNLISNAIKFTEHGYVSAQVQVVSTDDGDRESLQLIASVRDTGIGIAADQQDRVFRRFQQVDNNDDNVQAGTGLGLTISNLLVKLMGGSLGLESEPGEGSTFAFDIRLHRPTGEEALRPPADQVEEDAATYTVLLAEDGEVNREVARTMLQMRGHRVVEARNGMEAISMLEHRDIDIVLMDLQMPEMDGLEATRWIRTAEQKSGARVPIIGLSAHAMRGSRERCLEAGMDDFLTKPVSSRLLWRVIDQWGKGTPADSGTPGDETTDGGATDGEALRPAPPEPPDEAASSDTNNGARAIALQRMGGMEATLQAIVKKFADEAPRLAGLVADSIENGNRSECERAAHTLKGAAEVLAMTDLSAIALQVERSASAGDLAAARALLARLRTATHGAVATTAAW